MGTQVLIVGAGPTGLTLALWLKRLGVDLRIVDKDSGPGETSRALAIQARTLEFHRQIGVVDDVLAAGIRLEQIAVHTPSGVAAALKFGRFGQGLSPYPFAFALPQDVHEQILLAHLGRLGVRVERNTELTAFRQHESGVAATLRAGGTDETVETAYLCGCDGAHSAVRHGLNLEFPGGAYAQIFYVADVVGTGQITPHALDVSLGAYGFAIVMPVRQRGSVRLIGIVPKEHEADPKIAFADIRGAIERDTRISVTSVNWFTTYHVHHRVAERFQVGRVFIAGDAGHIHSPAGGQGMNTGMGDAINLAWKLAAVLQRRANARVLDSYEPERIAFARLLIRSTDQAFKAITSTSRAFGWFRLRLLPRILAVAFRTHAFPRQVFRLVSQIRINYRGSPISAGSAGAVKGGDRLPYVAQAGERDNFAPLASLDWQVHVYGTPGEDLRAALLQRGIALHSFPWTRTAGAAGLMQDAAYLIRPDGHVALAAPRQDPAPFTRYLDDFAIKPRTA